ETHNNLGACLFDQQLIPHAIHCYERAITLAPHLAAAHYNLGNARQAEGEHAAAAACYARALQLDPTYAAACTNLGVACYAAGQHDEAFDYYQRAIALEPNNVEAQNNLGVLYHDRKQYDHAIQCYRTAISSKPDYLDAQINLGLALKELGRFDEAVECYQRVIEAMPDCAEAHNNLGVVLQSARHVGQAEASYRRAIELRSDYAEAQCNLGALLRERASLTDAAAQFRQAIDCQPELVAAYVGLADTLSDLNDHRAAMQTYDRAVELAPDHAEARFSRSLALLRNGDFERGWVEFQWRWKTEQLNDRQLSAPRWEGQSLTGKRILIHAEQGIGDTFQFIRYLPLVQQLGGQVVFACSERLHPLLRNAPGLDEIVPLDHSLPVCDCHAPLLDLPRLFGTTLDSIPNQVPYLKADATLVEHWRSRLEAGSKRRIGICWEGNRNHRRNRLRSLSVECVSRLAGVPDVTLVSLQQPRECNDQLTTGTDVLCFPEMDQAPGAFIDSAAIIRNLDLVITCDTTIAQCHSAFEYRSHR
ncbi:MAG: tetratricopeptide repeat protein, partial [Planctomycetales bacterium]|nr:tetratricopeptide repeat protein [Planctomycetales bacterium]